MALEMWGGCYFRSTNMGNFIGFAAFFGAKLHSSTFGHGELNTRWKTKVMTVTFCNVDFQCGLLAQDERGDVTSCSVPGCGGIFVACHSVQHLGVGTTRIPTTTVHVVPPRNNNTNSVRKYAFVKFVRVC